MPLRLNGVQFMALVDSGSTRIMMHPSIVEELRRHGSSNVVVVPGDHPGRLADSNDVIASGTLAVTLAAQENGTPVEQKLVVANMVCPVTVEVI